MTRWFLIRPTMFFCRQLRWCTYFRSVCTIICNFDDNCHLLWCVWKVSVNFSCTVDQNMFFSQTCLFFFEKLASQIWRTEMLSGQPQAAGQGDNLVTSMNPCSVGWDSHMVTDQAYWPWVFCSVRQFSPQLAVCLRVKDVWQCRGEAWTSLARTSMTGARKVLVFDGREADR